MYLKECKWLKTSFDTNRGSIVTLQCIPCIEYKTTHHMQSKQNRITHELGQQVTMPQKETGAELNLFKLKLGKHENTTEHTRAVFANSQLKNREKNVLQKIASTALFCIVNALGDSHFEKEIVHLHTVGVDIGDSGHSRKLMNRWKKIAWEIVTSLVSKILKSPSACTNCWGVRFMGISIDKYSIKYNSFQIICVRTIVKGFMKGFPIAIAPCEYDNDESQVCYFCVTCFKFITKKNYFFQFSNVWLFF